MDIDLNVCVSRRSAPLVLILTALHALLFARIQKIIVLIVVSLPAGP